MVLSYFPESLHVFTHFHMQKELFNIETDEHIPHDSELSLIFIHLKDIVRNRNYPLYQNP